MDFNAWSNNFADAVRYAIPVHNPQSPRDQQSGIIARIAESAHDLEEVTRLLNSLDHQPIVQPPYRARPPTTSDTSGSCNKSASVEHELRRFHRRPGGFSRVTQRRIRASRERRLRANVIFARGALHLSSLYNGSVWGEEATGETTDELSEESDARYSVGVRRVRGVSEKTRRDIQSERERTRRGIAHSFGNTFHLNSLYNGSVWGHEGTGSTTDEVSEEGAVGYSAEARAEVEFWDQLSLQDSAPELPSRGLDTSRSFLGQTIVEARANVKRALLVATLEIKRDNLGHSAEFAWMLLNDRLVRERVVQWYGEVAQTWYFAFNQPARIHFLSIYQAEPAVIEALWDSL